MIALLLYYRGLLERACGGKVFSNGESNQVVGILMTAHMLTYTNRESNQKCREFGLTGEASDSEALASLILKNYCR